MQQLVLWHQFLWHFLRQEDSLQWEQGMMTWARRNINSRLLNELLTISFQFLSFDDLKKAMLVWGGGGAAHLWSLLELNFCFVCSLGKSTMWHRECITKSLVHAFVCPSCHYPGEKPYQQPGWPPESIISTFSR